MSSVADDVRAAFPAFRAAPRELAAALAASGRRRPVPAGTRLYSAGDPCSAVAFVLSGDIRVFRAGESGREITLYEIGPGETCILNASCILGGKPYPADAETVSDASLLLVPSADFRRLIASSEPLRAFVFEIMSRRLAAVMELVEAVAFGRMDQRLMDYLAEKAAGGELAATHQKIAGDLGTSREVVSRLLKDFERRRLVRLSRSSVALLKRA